MLFTLQEMYVLRKVKRFTPRMCVGRLFEHENRFGIKDISGEFWPIEFHHQPSDLKSGDVIQFYGEFVHKILHVQKIIRVVNQIKDWQHPQIPPPFTVKSALRFEILESRNLALERTKQFFVNRGFFYAETPILVPSGGMETYLNTFRTTYRDHKGRDWSFELPTSPEFALKKMIAEGVSKIFQISRAFRNNGEHSAFHEPEFMMLEWYRVGATLNEIMLDTQKLVCTLAQYLKSKKRIPKKWKTFQVNDLFIKIMDLDLKDLQNTQTFYEKSKHLSASLRQTDTWDDIFCKLFMEKIEPFLKKQIACFVTGYPVQMSALATENIDNPLFVERTEAYLFGVEICNGYQELVDAEEFEKRFKKTYAERDGNVRRDKHFENVMQFGLPPCSGNAVGIDRVIALLLGLSEIQPLFLFPHTTS